MLMDQKIFAMNLSLEATSAYIIICSLAESGAPITIESAGSFWNASPEALINALEELCRHSVIDQELDSNHVRRYFLNPADLWEMPAE